MLDIQMLARTAVQEQASDVHLRAGTVPRMRVASQLAELPGWQETSAEDLETLLAELMTPEQAELFAEQQHVDFSYSPPGIGRFRCNAFRDYHGPALVLRNVPSTIPTLESLRLPADLARFADLSHGLVLVTGASGSGKTSTLAALIHHINTEHSRHIITLEDPIEFVFESDRSLIHQRQLHTDVESFEAGILDATRQSPDVIVIGELRDTPSIRQALVAAEIGILVFATLHTNGSADAVDRIVDVFAPEEQPQIRTMLSQSLAGVVSQALLRRRRGQGRTPATEVLRATAAVANIIREGRTQDLPSVIQSGKALGMHMLEDSLVRLVEGDEVAAEEAILFARNRAALERRLERSGAGPRR